MFEGIALHGQFPFHRTVIDGAQVAHVKRGGVRADIDAFQKGLVFHHQVGVHFLEQQVPFAPETQKLFKAVVYVSAVRLLPIFSVPV